MSIVFAEWVASCSEPRNTACSLAWGDDKHYREKRFDSQREAEQRLFEHLVRDHGLSHDDARTSMKGAGGGDRAP